MPGKLPNRNLSTTISIGAVGAQSSSAGYSLGSGIETITLGDNVQQAYINFSLIKAHGGTIVQCRAEDKHEWEYYVIPENTKNFDKELGKIISMHLLKGQ